MANYNLAGQKIKDTYGQVAQVSGSTLVNGAGTATPIATSSIVSFDTEVSRSAAAAGFGAGTVDTSSLTPLSTFYAYTGSNDSVVDALVAATSSYLTSLPSGVVSSSAQVDLSQATGTAANATSASYAGNASTADSATTATSASYAASATSASYATSALSASYAPSADTSSYALSSLSSSYAGNSSTADSATSATSASYASTASYLEGGVPSAFPFTGSAGIQGNLDMNSGGAIIVSDWTGSLSSTSVLIGQTNNNETLVNTSGTKNVQIGPNVRIVESGTRDNVVVIGADISAAQNAVAIGQDIENNTDSGIAIGKGTRGYGNAGIAIGLSANQQGNYAIAIGANAQAQANNGIAIGQYAYANTNANQINIGDKLKYNSLNKGEFILDGAVSIPTEGLSGAGSTVTPNLGLSNFYTLVNGGATTTIANPSNALDGTTYIFKITNGQNITWDTAYKWEGGTPPTLSSGTDIITFVSIGGSELYGTYITNLS